MYTARKNAEVENGWDIHDPQDDYVCTVLYTSGADALLSHLNR
jgi:hypothetical protein